MSGVLISQPFPSKFIFEKFSVEHGLSSSAIYSLHQDKTGFLWIGTENGLNRYDGYSFKIFKNNPENKNTISDNYIWDICEDSSGNLWFATQKGLDKYDPVTGKIIHFINDPEDSNSIGGNEISSAAIDADNNLWIGTWGNGFNIYNFKEKKFLRFATHNTSLRSDIIWCIFRDSRNNIWIGSDGGGLLRYNYSGRNFDHFLYDKKDKYSISSNNITSVCEDNDGFIWIGTYGSGLNRYDYKTNQFIKFRSDQNNLNSISDDFIWKVFKDSRGLLWIAGVSKGLTQYDMNKNQFTRLQNNPYDPQSISSDLILDISEDRSHNLWVGTVGGLNKVDLNPQNFFHLKNELNNRNSLSGNFVFSICEDTGGDIWIANYEKGISRYNPVKNKFTFYTHDPANPKSLSNNQVRFIYEDKKGGVWIGNFFGGLNRYDRKTDTFIRYSADNLRSSLSSNNVRIMYEDNEGNFWIGTSGGGLNKLDREKNYFTHYLNNPADENSLSNNAVTALCEDKDGYLWIGTYDGGLNKFDKKNTSFKRYKNKHDDLKSIGSNIITYLYCDTKGNLWIGTWNGGLNLYNKNSDDFKRYREKDGLQSDVINGIGEDKKGNLWISTVKGITKFSTKGGNNEKEEFKNYDINDGIQKGELNPSAFFVSKNGWIYFGGSEGVNVFHPDSLYKNTNIPPVILTSFKKFNEELVSDIQPQFLKNLELDFDEDVISFEFSSLDFSRPAKNQFAYKLEGFDKDWIYSGSRRYATYTHLDPGRYTFRVKGTNNSGIWNSEGRNLSLIIHPPFWQTWWFRGLILLFAAAVLYSFYKIRVNRLLELERLRVKIASDLHDDIGSALTRISLETELAAADINSEDSGSALQRIGNMSREVISSMSDVVWSIDSRNDSIEDLINRMKDFSYSLYSAGNKQVLFEILNLDLGKKIKVDVRQNIYLIFKEAVNNSAKYSCSDSLKIVLKNESGKFIMVIHDPGTDFSPRKLTGHGLRNMQMRAERINGKLEFIKEDGFKVVFTGAGL